MSAPALLICRITFLRNLRDYRSMSVQVILPVCIIAILGIALPDGFSDSLKPFDSPRAVDYYSVTILVMMVFFGIVYAADTVFEQRRDAATRRVALAGVSVGVSRVGAWGATVLTVGLQALLIVLATGVLFNVPWTNNVPGAAIVIVTVAACAGMLGVFAGEVLHAYTAIRPWIQAIVFYWTFIAGGFIRFPVGEGGSALRLLRLASPAYHANRALLAVLFGGDAPVAHVTVQSAGVCAAITGFAALGILLVRRRQRGCL